MLNSFPWLIPTCQGIYCEPGRFYIDPNKPVDFAIVTHGHADHARAGHHHVLATPETLAIMATRFGEKFAQTKQALAYHQSITHLGVKITLLPAGHILGSAQVLLEFQSQRVIISGDYKRRYDPTCEPFTPFNCDLFVTEATFGLPVFKHPPISQELNKLISSLIEFPDRCHLVGVYALGKAQRVIASLRQLNFDRPIYLHPALTKLCELYQNLGIKQDYLIPINQVDKSQLRGEIVLAPPSALNNNGYCELPDPLLAIASGWVRIRANNKQHQTELPLIISDHADWLELNQTIDDIKPAEVWVMHGSEEALVHACLSRGYQARAMHELVSN